MIRFLPNEEINKQKWDDCIFSSSKGIVYACSWYLDIAAPGWAALVEGDYQTVMPLPIRKKMGFDYVYHPFFVQQLGVFGQECSHQQKVNDFICAIPSRFKIIETNLNTHNTPPEKFKMGYGITHHLQLSQPYAQIFGGYSENTRRNIKKAQKLGVHTSTGGSPEELINAFRQTKGRELPKLSERDYQTLSRLIYTGVHKGIATLELAYTPENNLCAGAVFFETLFKSIFLFSATTAEGRENGAIFFLIDSYIQKNCNRSVVLDFEGSKISGLARFYKGFGSKECVFLQVRKNQFPWMIKPFVKLYKLLR